MSTRPPSSARHWAFIVINPAAGNCQPERVRQVVTTQFDNANIGYEFYETTIDPQLTHHLQRAKKDAHCEMVIVAGGDGTVSAVANNLANGEVPLGILPLGTGNLVARELGIPLDLDAAYRVLTEPTPITRIDVMEINGGIFVSHVSLGLYAKIALTTTNEEKQRGPRSPSGSRPNHLPLRPGDHHDPHPTTPAGAR